MTTDPADVVATLREQLAEVRRRTAQRCAEIARSHRGVDDLSIWTRACVTISDEIVREFALAEQPPQPQAQQQAQQECRCELFNRHWNGASNLCEACGKRFHDQPISPPAQDAGERHAVIERARVLEAGHYLSKCLRNRNRGTPEMADTLDALLKMVNP